MYLPIETGLSCASAWLAAAQRVNALPGHEAHNVIIGVTNPTAMSNADMALIKTVDSFLRQNDKYPVETVANTVFPAALYKQYGAPKFYDIYLNNVYPRIKKKGDWGRYFERMISYPLDRKGSAIRPLQDIVEKMRQNVSKDRCFQNIYELTIYDPIRDAGPVMNRQCLSFLSFKVTDDAPRKLLLTALYRNHYYVQRLLGNLIGLGRLMNFVATEVGLEVGDLTIVSTHAEIDNVASRSAIKKLLDDCQSIEDDHSTMALKTDSV